MPDTALGRFSDARWPYESDEVANVYAASPDQRIRFGFLPETSGPLWKAAAVADPFHGEPSWLVTMDDHTPAEIVSDFAAALIAAHAEGPGRYLTESHPIALDETLVAAGWTAMEDERLSHPLWQSPDGHAEVHHLTAALEPAAELAGTQARWLITGGTDDNRWLITASSATPTHLVSSLYGAVVSPVPVRRYGSELHTAPAQASVRPLAPVRGSSRALAAHAGSALIRSLQPAAAIPRPAAGATERPARSR